MKYLDINLNKIHVGTVHEKLQDNDERNQRYK